MAPAVRLSLVDVAGEHALGEERFIFLGAVSCVGPHARCRVARADQDRQPSTIVSIGDARIPRADQAVGAAYADMVLVANTWGWQGRPASVLGDRRHHLLCFGIFDGPAGIAILLPSSAGLSFQRSGTWPSLIAIFSSWVSTLLGRGHHGDIDDLTAHGEIAAVGERGIEASEELVDRLGFVSGARGTATPSLHPAPCH
jgi:hypothetical protein